MSADTPNRRRVLLLAGALLVVVAVIVAVVVAVRSSDHTSAAPSTAPSSATTRAGTPTAPTSATNGQGAAFVALGDSYSAGVGAAASAGGCDRNNNAYPALWAAANHPSGFAFLACSGATVPGVLDQVASAPSSASLVSLTVGGNDVGFSNVLLSCTIGQAAQCAGAIDQANATLRQQLPALLDRLFTAITARMPRARVVVLGYPHFFAASTPACTSISATNQAAINTGIDALDQAIATAAAAHKFVFADPRTAFTGHELCTPQAWLHGVDTSDLGESYHPTADGQREGYLPVFSAAAH